jgi:hypothetical protein
MRLTVHQASRWDLYRDLVRIPDSCRKDQHQKPIKEGRVVRLEFGSASRLVVVRGVEGCDVHKNCTDELCIHMDEVTRDHLKVAFRQVCDFRLKPVHRWGELRWAWNATEIGYRISAQLAAVGVALGVVALIPTIWDLTRWVARLLACVVGHRQS